MKTKRPAGLFLISLFKMTKGILFVALAIGAFKLLNKDVSDLFAYFITRLHIDLEHQFIQNILASLDLVDNHILKEISAAAFIFSGLLFAESLGLFFQKRWAEYMTVIETGLFIPVEVFEIIKHLTISKGALLSVNCIVVLYLIRALTKNPPKR